MPKWNAYVLNVHVCKGGGGAGMMSPFGIGGVGMIRRQKSLIALGNVPSQPYTW